MVTPDRIDTQAGTNRLVSELEIAKPWNTPDYLLLAFYRRWLVTFGTAFTGFILHVPITAIAISTLLAFIADYFLVPRFAWDLRVRLELMLLHDAPQDKKITSTRNLFFCINGGTAILVWWLSYSHGFSVLAPHTTAWLIIVIVFAALLWNSTFATGRIIAVLYQLSANPATLPHPFLRSRNFAFILEVLWGCILIWLAYSTFLDEAQYQPQPLRLGILIFILLHATNNYIAIRWQLKLHKIQKYREKNNV